MKETPTGVHSIWHCARTGSAMSTRTRDYLLDLAGTCGAKTGFVGRASHAGGG